MFNSITAQISDTKFHSNWIINDGSTNKNVFTPLNKVWPPLTGLHETTQTTNEFVRTSVEFIPLIE
jgi:hypothetical protein